VLTARDSYRQPVSPEAAIGELRAAAGSQFDPRVVEAFATVLASEDLSFGHGDDADFEAELAFERRVREYAHRRRGLMSAR
jgi:HD-GYP domain-containing protein (c-di-GMP phosphodiesterase class II)